MNRRGQRVGRIVASMLAIYAVSLPAWADFDSAPFGLRVLLALDRQSNYATTLGRQASIAFLDGASLNPAAAGLHATPHAPFSFTASYLDASTSSGRRLMASPLTARWPVGGGSFYAAYVYTNTPERRGDGRYLAVPAPWPACGVGLLSKNLPKLARA